MCIGESLTFTCRHNNTAGQQSRWILPGVSTLCTVAHDGSPAPNCSPFTITMISDSSGSTLTSTVQITATESLDNTTIECLAGGLLSSPQVGNVTLHVINGEKLNLAVLLITTHPIMLEIPFTYNWTTNLRASQDSSVLEWDPPSNSDYQRCITGYSISWNGGQYNTTNASTSVARDVLLPHGFPYCQTQAVTVTPIIAVTHHIVLSTTNITLYKPGIRQLSSDSHVLALMVI